MDTTNDAVSTIEPKFLFKGESCFAVVTMESVNESGTPIDEESGNDMEYMGPLKDQSVETGLYTLEGDPIYG
jgi:hypothetical protein